ncbi:leukemia-associated protein 7 [Erpetoichthys calabaricus]|uniref:leukemia-associated protein 7 n=1 Tax=Erpetoichthys calabaricus TaxID=27687 RepID=UPI002234B908|nr:leukemia-associated protein 7 [Erpetoichthys calabaricus]
MFSSVNTASIEHQLEALVLIGKAKEGHAQNLSNRSSSNTVYTEAVGRPGQRRTLTLAQKGREGLLSRLAEVASEVIREQQSLIELPQTQNILVHPKQSIELKNICSRMALQVKTSHTDRNLKDLRDCLKSIAETLLSSLSNSSTEQQKLAARNLGKMLSSFPEL